jgi:hypothetical protein
MAQPNFTPRPAPKKGLPVVAWIGIGCVGIVIVGIVAVVIVGTFAAKKARDFAAEAEANPTKVAAETFVRLNPEIELVASDGAAGTITVRDKKTGKVATFNYSDVEKGRLTFETEGSRVEFNADQGPGGMTVKTDKGETHFGASASAANVPDWVPLHPDATRIEGAFATHTAAQQAGAVSFTVPGDVDSVTQYYRSWMAEKGYEVNTTVMSSGQGQSSLLVGQNRTSGRTISVTATPEKDGSRVAVQYSSKES